MSNTSKTFSGCVSNWMVRASARLIPVAEIPKLVAAEKISHSLVVVTLDHFDLWQRGLKSNT